MLASLDGAEADKGNLHAGQRAKRIPSRIADIEPGAVSAHADQDKGMHRQQASNEGVTSPRCHHVAIGESAKRTPKHRT